MHTDAAVDLQARWEADLVEPVIQHCAESVDGADLPEEPGGQPDGEKTVLHRGAEHSGLGPLGVDVDPLLVAR